MSPLFIFAVLLLIVVYALSWHDEPAHEQPAHEVRDRRNRGKL